MPFRALIKNQEVISIDYSDKQWDDLKTEIKKDKLEVQLFCCGGQGILRTSKLGLKHFAHKKSDSNCDWKPESPEHMWGKKAIIEGCIEAGWNVVPEFSGENWRADVYAHQGNKKIAFEVQWSPQTYEETKFRQERYKKSGVRGCWFFKKPPHNILDYNNELIEKKEIPSFVLKKDDDGQLYSELNKQKMKISHLVRNLLGGNVKFCNHYTIPKGSFIEVVFFDTNCWKCRRPQQVWTLPYMLNPQISSKCGVEIAKSINYNGSETDFNPVLINSIFNYCKTDAGSHLKLGEIKHRYSKTVGESYLSHGCYYCDTIFGNHFMSDEKLNACYSPNRQQILLVENFKIEQSHWCFSEQNNFCE